MSPTTLVVIAAVIGVLLTVAGSVGVWLAIRTGQSSQTVKNFQEAAASWREKAEALSSDLENVRTEMAALRSQHERLQFEHEALKDVVTGKTAVEAMAAQMGLYKDEILSEIQKNGRLLQTLAKGTS